MTSCHVAGSADRDLGVRAALEDLVEEGYLRQIPTDPITGSDETWETEVAPWMMTDLGQPAGIWNVWSGSDEDAIDGTPYREW